MSRFTFARGNASKVLALPLYAVGALASAVVPRRAGHWVFGCGSGVGEGALPLLLTARAEDPSLTLTWLSRNRTDAAAAAALGIRSVPLMSWRGFWHTLRAQVLVVTHGFGDVNRFGTRGGFIVQLWHGIPLKLIHLDSPATVRLPILSRFWLARVAVRHVYRRMSRGIRLLPAASEVAAARLRTAFALPADRVVVTGDPRDDVLFRGTRAERAAAARSTLTQRLRLPEVPRGQVLLFAPTWRDGEIDPGIPTEAQWRSIAEWLDSANARLVLRPHPLSVGDYGTGPRVSGRIHLLDSSLQPDITPLLPAVDLLITDYSSIAYDFALTGGDILYLAPDLDSYAVSRGLYEPYQRFSGGLDVASWGALLGLLSLRERNAGFRATLGRHSASLALRNHAYRDGRNTVRVYEEIVSRLKGTP